MTTLPDSAIASTSLESPVVLHVELGIAHITLNRPQARNALSKALVAAGQAAIESLADDASIRCLIVTGAGPQAFCAGADLKERLNMSLEQTRGFLAGLNGFCNALAGFRAPTIAAINGAAFGGGLEIALACDIRLAAASAMVGLPEVKLGIIPGAGGTQRLSRACGLAVAKGLILTGRKVAASEALSLGLVSAVVDDANLATEAKRWAAEIAQAGPLAVTQAKLAIEEGYGQPFDAALATERQHYEVVLASQDRLEGLSAFAEKRAPKFQGR